MTSQYVTPEWVAATVARTRAEQGLPPRIEDPVALDKVATLIRPWLEEQQVNQVPKRAA